MKYLNLIKGLLLTVSVMASSSAWSQCPAGTGMVGVNADGSPSCASQGGGGGGGGGASGGYVPPTIIHLPTSYGAVAWDGSTNTYGYSSKQASKQASSIGGLRYTRL